ncbi:MAG: hypothetical protein ACPGVD_04350 [Flavobacteriales bacterium]
MKKNQLVKIALIVFLFIGLSACTAKKKKKKCNTCPTFEYVASEN